MANTTNYNWETPDDTDLVKDGAAAIRTLGSSIDTTTKALNPSTTLGDIEYRSATANTNTRLAVGTTGQVLTVAAGVPSWATPTVGDITAVSAGTGISGGGTSGDITITNSMATAIDAKGDLVVGTGADTFSRLAVGTNTYVLTADSAEATGLKWAAPAAGGSFAGVRVKKSTSQSIPNATETVLTFDTETFDTDGFHDNSTNSGRLTVPVGKAGYYSIYFCIQWDVNATGDREVSLYINGTATGLCGSNQAGDATLYIFNNGTTTFYLAEGDYVQLTGYQDRGGALNAGNSARISFGMNKVG
jgi:hypothetical protein